MRKKQVVHSLTTSIFGSRKTLIPLYPLPDLVSSYIYQSDVVFSVPRAIGESLWLNLLKPFPSFCKDFENDCMFANLITDNQSVLLIFPFPIQSAGVLLFCVDNSCLQNFTYT